MREIIADSRMMHIGKNGEGDALRVTFPVVAEWEALYGAGGVWTLNVQRFGDALAYAAQDFKIADGAALWVVTDADAAVVGEGRCELTYKIGDTVAKSRTYAFRVDRSLTGGGDVPDPVKGWQEALEERVDGKLDRPDGGSAGDVLTKTGDGEEWKKPTGGDYNLTDEDKKEIAAEIIENGEQAKLGGTPVIAPETAEVGQIIKVKAVDDSGKPTQWEAVDMPSGGNTMNFTWKHIRDVDLTSDTVEAIVSTTEAGDAFSYDEILMEFTPNLSGYFYVRANKNANYSANVHVWTENTKYYQMHLGLLNKKLAITGLFRTNGSIVFANNYRGTIDFDKITMLVLGASSSVNATFTVKIWGR